MKKVTPATSIDDVERINRFFNSSEIKEDLHWFTYQDTLERAYERDDRSLLYIESNDRIIAGLMIWCKSRVLDPGEAQIRLVAVDRDYRGRGIGSHLCECAEAFAARQSQDQVIADVVAESPAVAFWKSIGYNVIDEWNTDGGRRMLTVKKTLQ